ncbi:right-handed parallel beta-helix repeat-containing protein [Candidatus Acetothermia bacterium]|nr:right-handed parallel beta-helix repeat-containing protein [Candidatus Acetothermia bacterium]MBI3643390.1 right-handed parallel beta-helix repeat-containing protein [Candidatus Acetothermia bacterium]
MRYLIIILSLLMLIEVIYKNIIEVESKMVHVNCQSVVPCSDLIGRATQVATPGSIIKVGHGTYREKMIRIGKDLTIESTDSDAPKIVFENVKAGISIELEPGRSVPMVVQLSNLDLEVSDQLGADSGKGATGLSILGRGLKDINAGKHDYGILTIKLQKMKISGALGIAILGATAEVNESVIAARVVGVRSDYSVVNFVGNKISVNSLPSDKSSVSVILQQSAASFDKNDIEGGFFGIFVALGGKSSLNENNISNAGTGVVIMNGVAVNVEKNNFVDNVKFGIALSLQDCVANSDPAPLFTSTVTGKDNHFQGNGHDLCPEKWDWQTDFKTMH